MVRAVTIVLLLVAVVAGAAEKQYFQFPDATTLPDNGRVLMYDPAGGSKNITGAALKSIFPNRSSASQIEYGNSTVKAALDSLTYQPISISLYTMSGSSSNVTQEIGSSYSLAGSGLYWETSKTPNVQTINGTARTAPYMPSGSPFSTNQSWTLYVNDGQSSAQSTRSVTFTHKRFWGVSANPTLSDEEIRALSSEFSTSRSQSRTLSPVGQYMYVVYVETGGAASIKVNGFNDTWDLLIRDFVNASGNTTLFRIYRSAFPLTGTYEVVVS